jgi:hypothetical protein
VEFLARLRGQLTFSSPKALVEQMWSDIAAARAYFLEPAQLVEDPLSGHPMTANSGLDGRVDSE